MLYEMAGPFGITITEHPEGLLLERGDTRHRIAPFLNGVRGSMLHEICVWFEIDQYAFFEGAVHDQ